MSDGILPSLFVLLVVREAIHDELVDAVQCDLLVASALDGHCNQRDILQIIFKCIKLAISQSFVCFGFIQKMQRKNLRERIIGYNIYSW